MSDILQTQLDDASIAWIKAEAQRTGTSVETIVRQLIYRAIAVERQQARHQRNHDLDALAGTWTDTEADEFLQSIEQFNEIDKNLWL